MSHAAIDVSASSYFSRPGEARDEYHPRYGMDADTMTCFRSGYHSVPWWQATLDVLYDVDYVDFYGRLELSLPSGNTVLRVGSGWGKRIGQKLSEKMCCKLTKT